LENRGGFYEGRDERKLKILDADYLDRLRRRGKHCTIVVQIATF
jgi:hypothetical protein